MKTVILAGLDNLVFAMTDVLNPKNMKLVGIASEIKEAWNIYDEDGTLLEEIKELPIMPLETAVTYESDCMVLVAGNKEDEEALKYMVYRTGYQGEVRSLFDISEEFALKTSVLRRVSRRLDELGVEGAIADLGAYRGDISWQLNAMMPERKLYLFDTFTGYDERDIAKEQQLQLSEAQAGTYSLSSNELEHLNERILGRMPYADMVEIRSGWFPETAFDLEDEKYAMVHIDTGLYAPTYSGIQYFFPRMSKGGVILVSGYTNGKSQSVCQAVRDLEEKYGAFLIAPLCDIDGTIMIMRP